MSLTIDGKRLNELNLALLPGYQHPAAPPIRDYTVSIPGLPGAYYFGSDVDPLEFNLPLIIKPQEDRFLLSAAIRKMVAAFIDPYGKPKEVKLIFDYEPDKYYKARFSGSIPIDRYFRMGKFELPLIAYDPYPYSVVTNDDVTWGSQNITFENTSYTYNHTGGGKIQTITSPQAYRVFVSGLVQRPIITMSGSGSNVIVSVNNKSFSLGTFGNTNWLIDGNNWTVLKNGENGLSDYNKNFPQGDWLELVQGENNIAVYGTGLNLTMQVKIRDKFM
ncbi:phage tail protein [Bacillus cereus]|uniref:distal tail protein Dit n=1 Tax=Bacillus cereus TaxID=1396 RepID=UPI000BF5FB8B|nr:distal tail protein Dit [Bacillus cereus]PFS27745.1 phage tail protein [Bacillus cereus]